MVTKTESPAKTISDIWKRKSEESEAKAQAAETMFLDLADPELRKKWPREKIEAVLLASDLTQRECEQKLAEARAVATHRKVYAEKPKLDSERKRLAEQRALILKKQEAFNQLLADNDAQLKVLYPEVRKIKRAEQYLRKAGALPPLPPPEPRKPKSGPVTIFPAR